MKEKTFEKMPWGSWTTAQLEQICKEQEKYILYKPVDENDPIFKLRRQCRSFSLSCFCTMKRDYLNCTEKKPRKIFRHIGLQTAEEFAYYLSSLFYNHPITGKRMKMSNRGNKKGTWQIDHIIPVETIKTKADFIKVSHCTNLQPLWHEDHLEKSKWDRKWFGLKDIQAKLYKSELTKRINSSSS